MSTAVDWPAAFAPDPPGQMVAAWLARMGADGTHLQRNEDGDAVQHPGLMVKLCAFISPTGDPCGHWYICGRAADVTGCGMHPYP